MIMMAAETSYGAEASMIQFLFRSQNAITIDVANKSTSHGDYIHGIEAFIGTDFDDTFNGDNNDNGFTGGFGKMV